LDLDDLQYPHCSELLKVTFNEPTDGSGNFKLKRSLSNPSAGNFPRSLRRRSVSDPRNFAGTEVRKCSEDDINSNSQSFYESDSSFFDPYAPANDAKSSQRSFKIDSVSKEHIVSKAIPTASGNEDADPSHEDRVKLDELEYLVDGLKQNQSLNVRMTAAKELASLLKKGDVLTQLRGFMGCDKIFKAFEDTKEIQLAYMGGILGCLIADAAAATNLLGEPFIRSMRCFMNFKDPLIEQKLGEDVSTTNLPRKRRRRILRKSSSKINNNKLCLEAISLINWDKSLRDVEQDITPHFLSVCGLASALGNEKFRALLLQNHTDIVKIFVTELTYGYDSIITSKLSLDVLSRERIRILSNVVEILTHEDDSDPIFLKIVGKTNLSELLTKLGQAMLICIQSGTSSDRFSTSFILWSLKLLVNITNSKDLDDAIVEPLVPVVFKTLRDFKNSKETLNFDIRTLALAVLINSCEESNICRVALSKCKDLDGKNAKALFLDLFETNSKIDESVESHALAAYSAMVLGLLVQASESDRVFIRNRAKSQDFSSLVRVLQDFIVLQCKANMLTEESLKSLVKIVDVLQKEDHA